MIYTRGKPLETPQKPFFNSWQGSAKLSPLLPSPRPSEFCTDEDNIVNRSAMDALRSSLGRYVFGSEISYNKAPPRLPGLGC